MKKVWITALLVLLLCALALTASANTLDEETQALYRAETFEEQLEILNRIADEYADVLENGGWGLNLRAGTSPDLPEGLIPGDWEAHGYTKADGFPKELREHKFIVMDGDLVAGQWFCRLPAQMRAASLEEAEYVLVVDSVLTKSSYEYIPPATSYHRDYAAYALNIKTGEAVRFWSHRNSAKRSGKWGQLDGDIWGHLRSQIWGEIRYGTEDGAELIFGITGKQCYLKNFTGEPVNLTVPAAPEGYPVTEIGETAFYYCETLQSVILPEGLIRISKRAFMGCENLESVVLPSTLDIIGQESFYGCNQLADIALPENLKTLGERAFCDSGIGTVTVPGSVRKIESVCFNDCSRMTTAVLEEGVSSIGTNAFLYCNSLRYIYLPASLGENLDKAGIELHTVVCAPEGSYALNWATEQGYETRVCASPAEMPAVELVTENGFDFLISEDEASVRAYNGDDPHVTVPDEAAGVPVTTILPHALYDLESAESITLPRSVRRIMNNGIEAAKRVKNLDVYIPNPDCAIDEAGVRAYSYSDSKTVTIHAPEGSAVQRYVTETNQATLLFEAWGEGVNPDARVLRDALALAAQVQESTAEFWQLCDQAEYTWIGRVPGYDMSKPEAAAVLRLTPAQYDDLALLMAGPENVVKVFAAIVNTQWNLPYARAAAQTARDGKFDPVADGSCAIAVLCYRNDLVAVALQQDGKAQAALVCSSPAIVKGMSAEYVKGIAAQYGISGECTVYTGGEVESLLAK